MNPLPPHLRYLSSAAGQSKVSTMEPKPQPTQPARVSAQSTKASAGFNLENIPLHLRGFYPQPHNPPREESASFASSAPSASYTRQLQGGDVTAELQGASSVFETPKTSGWDAPTVTKDTSEKNRDWNLKEVTRALLTEPNLNGLQLNDSKSAVASTLSAKKPLPTTIIPQATATPSQSNKSKPIVASAVNKTRLLPSNILHEPASPSQLPGLADFGLRHTTWRDLLEYGNSTVGHPGKEPMATNAEPRRDQWANAAAQAPEKVQHEGSPRGLRASEFYDPQSQSLNQSRMPAPIRTGEAAIWTKSTEKTHVLKASKDFPCSYEACLVGFDTARDLRDHKKTSHDFCAVCQIDFYSFEELHLHKLKATTRHITCPKCSEDFKSSGGRDRHVFQLHPMEQNLDCPGCGEKFVKAGAMVAHIERNACKMISDAQFNRAQAMAAIFKIQSTNLVGENEREDNRLAMSLLDDDGSIMGDNENVYMASFPPMEAAPARGPKPVPGRSYASTVAGPSGTRPVWGPPPSSASIKTVKDESEGKIYAKKDLEPASETVWIARQSGYTRADDEDAVKELNLSGWIKSENIEDKLPSIVFGGDHTISGLFKADGTAFEEVDPKSHKFDSSLFRNILGKYSCPYMGCQKSFPSERAFIGHLESPIHTGRDHRCVACCRIFKTPSALIAHMESSATKCRIKDSSLFDQSIRLASGGFLGVEGLNVDGTVKFESAEPEGW